MVKPNEEVQLDFAGPLRDELKRDAYILVAIEKWSKTPTAKVVSNTKADLAIKFMQRYISNNGVQGRLRCDQAQTFRAKKFQFFRPTNNIKLLYAPVDDHRAVGVVERMIQTLKRRFAVINLDQVKTPYKLASDVAELIKTLRITPHGVTKQQQETGAISKSIKLAQNKLNIRYKGIQRTKYKNKKKRIDQLARKTIILGTKVKDPKTFEQKYKTIEWKITHLYTTHGMGKNVWKITEAIKKQRNSICS